MKDRFKYKYWDTKEKEMIHNAIEHQFRCLGIEYSNKEREERLPDGKDILQEDSLRLDFDYDRFIPLMCTGLKDKNGVLIYDGYIVKVAQEFKDIEIRVISYNEGAYYFSNNDELGFLIHGDCEVIGNKFEHKHLLD